MKTELTKIAATMQTLTSTLLVLAGRVAEPHREDAPEPCPLCGTEMPVDSQTHTAASGDECEGVCPDCSCPVSYDDDLERYLHVDDHATCFIQQTSTDLLRRPRSDDEYYFDGEHDGFRDIDAFLSANADDFSPEMVAKIRGLEPGGLVNIPIHMGYAILRRGDRVACDGCGSLVPASEVETHGGGDPLCNDCFDKTEAEFDRGHAEDEAAIAAHAVNARQTAFGAYRSASEKDTDTWTCRCGQSLPLTEAYCPCGLQEREGEAAIAAHAVLDSLTDYAHNVYDDIPSDLLDIVNAAHAVKHAAQDEDGFHCHGCNAHHGDEVAMGLDGNGHTYCYPSTTLLDLFPCQHCRILVPCTEALGHTGSEKYPETEYFCPDCFGEHSVLMTDDDMPLPGDEPVALWLSEDDIQTLLFACTDSVNVMERLLVEVGMEDDRATRTPAEIDDVKRLRDQILALKVTR